MENERQGGRQIRKGVERERWSLRTLVTATPMVIEEGGKREGWGVALSPEHRPPPYKITLCVRQRADDRPLSMGKLLFVRRLWGLDFAWVDGGPGGGGRSEILPF